MTAANGVLAYMAALLAEERGAEHPAPIADQPAYWAADGNQLADVSDGQIEAALRGDPESWTALVRSCQRDVGRQMWRFSRDARVCEELMQDVFVELYHSLPRFQRRGVPFEHWVRRIATRVGYRYWKNARRLNAAPLPTQPAASLRAPCPVNSMAATEAAELLHGLLAELREADRLVLTLMYFEDCDVAEITRRTGWNRAMVKMRLMRARRKLKALVESRGLNETLGSIDHG
jgi:RNA polymerase sigma-70 factor (ECF subfamily)